jgi:hypothetical protein
MHDLEAVAFVELGARVLASRHHLAVPFHRDGPLSEPQMHQELAQAEAVGHLLIFAIYHQLHQALVTRASGGAPQWGFGLVLAAHERPSAMLTGDLA